MLNMAALRIYLIRMNGNTLTYYYYFGVSCRFNDSVMTILHSLSNYDCRFEAFPLIFSEKKMLAFSFRKYILSIKALRT